MTESNPTYETRIQKLEEAITFLDDHIVEQDKEILNLQKKVDKAVLEIKDLRKHYDSGGLSSKPADEKPPHY